MIQSKQWIACVIRQYGTGLYRSCVDLGGRISFCLHTTPDESVANEVITRFLDAHKRGEIRTSEDIIAFRDDICGKSFEVMAA